MLIAVVNAMQKFLMSEAIIIAGCDLLGRLSKNEGLPSDTSVTIVVISPHACAYADLRGRLSKNEVKVYCDMSAHADVSNACVSVLRWACADVCVCAACGHVCAYIDAPCCIKVSRGGSGAKA